MNSLFTVWNESSLARRSLFVGLVAALLACFAAGAYWVLAPNYRAAFSNLRAQDAATVTAEMDKQKLKYRLAAGGTAVLVPEGDVDSTRLKILGKGLPLAGTVGFELFNNADLGLTEFAQKVNYQRALQGELARTIMSMEAVETARVHLTLPDSGYLRRAGSKAKASITLALKAGAVLDKATVRSIQRMVAAAVPDLELSDVAVINQANAAPGAVASNDLGAVSSDPRMEQKFELEEHYARRISAQADKIFGAGRTQVTVDLLLNFDQTKILNETTASTGQSERAPNNKVITETLSGQVVTQPLVLPDSGGSATGVPSTTSAKRQSQRRVEETMVAPGGIRKVNVAALVQGTVDRGDLERFRALVASTVGLNPDRGDSLVIFNSEGGVGGKSDSTPSVINSGAIAGVVEGGKSESVSAPAGKGNDSRVVDVLSWVVTLAVLASLAWWFLRNRRSAANAAATTAGSLTEEQRAQMVRRLSDLLQEKAARA